MTATPSVMLPIVKGMLLEPGGATAVNSAGRKALMAVPMFCPIAIAETR